MRIRTLAATCAILVAVVLFGGACTPAAAPAPAPVTPAPPEDPLAFLAAREAVTLSGSALGDGIILPAMSSARGDPKAALGALYVRVAKPGRLCTSQEPGDFQFERIQSVPLKAGCTAETSGSQEYVEQIVRGGADATLGLLVGEAGASAKYAYELHVSNPVSAYYPASHACVDIERVATIPMLPRACDVLFVEGATQTLVVLRQYTEVEANVKYNTVLNIEGRAYGSQSNMQSFLLLTGNLSTLRHWFALDADGYLAARTVAEARSAAELAEALSPPWFDAVNALAPPDFALLPGIIASTEWDPAAVPVVELEMPETILVE